MFSNLKVESRGLPPLDSDTKKLTKEFIMSDKMIAAAKTFAKGKRTTFPIMTVKELHFFLQQIRKESELLKH